MNAGKQNPAGSFIRRTLGPDERYEGVYKINLYILRLMFLLIIFFVGSDSWGAIFTHQGPWDPMKALAVSVWAAFSALCILGLLDPVRWIPLVLFEIFYKAIWLIIVAFPLWRANQLVGSPAEDMTYAFLWLPLPIIAVPWVYVFKNYFRFPKKERA